MKINVIDQTVQTVALVSIEPDRVNVTFAPDNIQVISTSEFQIVVKELS